MPVGRSWPLVLADGYQQLSAHSAYSRFHTLYSELSPTRRAGPVEMERDGDTTIAHLEL